MAKFNYLGVALSVFVLCACKPKTDSRQKTMLPVDSDLFYVADSSFFQIVNPKAEVAVIADSFNWSEGPLWVPSLKAVLFSDVPENTIFQWSEEGGLKKYLSPSGYTGEIERGGEMGSNGLTLNLHDELVICQHGNRRIAAMKAPLNSAQPTFETIAGMYEGKRFNSPNDLCYDSHGNLYFTDPPYGLVKQVEDSSKEIPFQGVYMVNDSGKVVLLLDSLTRPNGIALTPNEKQLIVANSDIEKPFWYIYDIDENGTLARGSIFYSAADYVSRYEGLPDGLKIDSNGNVFAAGPGGIWVFNNAGNFLGIIKTGQRTSNCAFGEDEKTLFITADMYLMRVKLRP